MQSTNWFQSKHLTLGFPPCSTLFQPFKNYLILTTPSLPNKANCLDLFASISDHTKNESSFHLGDLHFLFSTPPHDNSVEEEVKTSLISFLTKLSNNNGLLGISLGWNSTLDPCKNKWHGVTCDHRNTSVTMLVLERLNLSGTLDAASLCGSRALAASITALFLVGNNIGGGIPAEIANCKQLTHT